MSIILLGITLRIFVLSKNRVNTHTTSGTSALDAPAPKLVAVYIARRRDLAQTITLGAELHPYNVAKLYAKVSGYLKTISVDYGSHVYAGEVIAQLEVPEQETEAARTETAYQLAKLNYSRIASVEHQTPGLIAQQDVDQAQASYEIAKQERNHAQVLLDYDQILAPFNGIVTQRNVDPGALIQEAATSSSAIPIVEISEEDRLRLVIEAPESIVTKIKVGTPVLLHIRGTDATFSDHVARLSSEVHEETRTMHTEVDVPNQDLRLKPGMYADVTITLAQEKNSVAIPTQALRNNGFPSVLVVDKDHRLRERNVSIGLQTPAWIQITHGVEPGNAIYLGDPNSVTLGETVEPKIVATILGSK